MMPTLARVRVIEEEGHLFRPASFASLSLHSQAGVWFNPNLHGFDSGITMTLVVVQHHDPESAETY